MIQRASISASALAALSLATLLAPAQSADATGSVARAWNETTLNSIKKDLVRPPVQARNLFHLSVAMYDAWACYDVSTQGYFFQEKITAKGDVEAARDQSISYAAYRLLKHRFALSPNVAIINGYLDAQMAALGYPTNVTTTVGNSPAAVGNRIAALVIQQGLADGSREAFNHAKAAGTYLDVNEPLIVAMPFNPSVTNLSLIHI